MSTPRPRPGRRQDYRQEAKEPGTHHGAPGPGPYDDAVHGRP
ncbi:hypothetical protein [Streptomyces sp. NPDC059513]